MRASETVISVLVQKNHSHRVKPASHSRSHTTCVYTAEAEDGGTENTHEQPFTAKSS